MFAIGLLCTLATALSAVAWQLASPGPARRPYTPIVRVPSDASPQHEVEKERVPVDAMFAFKTADPLKAFGGIPLEKGDVIGYAVDGDVAMAPYIESVAFVVNAVNEAIESPSIRFGIVTANAGDGPTIVDVVEPTNDLVHARSVLTGRLPGGQTDLTRALAKMTDWDASKIFLIVAKRVEAGQLAMLTETAEQTGAAVHVIALGEAAKQKELSRISDATGGSFLALTPQMMTDWVARVEKARDDAANGKPSI